jgi:hypothetical protein
MADKLMASVLFCLPNTIYDLPAFNLLFGSANKTTPLLIYQPLSLVQVALLSMVNQKMMTVASQYPVQAMSTATA